MLWQCCSQWHQYALLRLFHCLISAVLRTLPRMRTGFSTPVLPATLPSTNGTSRMPRSMPATARSTSPTPMVRPLPTATPPSQLSPIVTSPSLPAPTTSASLTTQVARQTLTDFTPAGSTAQRLPTPRQCPLLNGSPTPLL